MYENYNDEKRKKGLSEIDGRHVPELANNVSEYRIFFFLKKKNDGYRVVYTGLFDTLVIECRLQLGKNTRYSDELGELNASAYASTYYEKYIYRFNV